MRHASHERRAKIVGAGLALLAGLTISAAFAPPAAANFYEVRACDAADGANNSWFPITNSKNVLAYAACPSSGDRKRGLAARNYVGSGGKDQRVRQGTAAGLLFAAPPGTTIIAIRAGYDFYRVGGGWQVALATPAQLLKGCKPGSATCERFSANQYVGVPSAPLVYIEAICERATCSTASTGDRAHGFVQASANLYSATVRLEDDSQPSIDTPGGSLWSDGWHSGNQTVSFHASDNSGIAETRVLSDGTPALRNTRPCDYTRVLPCPNSGDSFTLDTSSIKPDGEHTLTVQAVDAAGNVAQAARKVLVDNTPPGPPENLAVDGGDGWRATNSFTIDWRNPAADGGAPVTGALYELCPVAGGACQAGEREGDGITSIDNLSVPSAGDWLLHVWLRDGAGNADQRTSPAPVELRFDDEAPQAAFAPEDPDNPTQIVVQASDGVSGVASGTIEVKKADANAWQPLTTSLAGQQLVATLDDEGLPDGVYELQAHVVDQAGNERTTFSRTDGSPATVTLPLRLETRISAGFVRRLHGRRHTRHSVLRPVGRVAFGTHARFAGRLTSADGNPLAGTQVLVMQLSDVPGATWTPVATVMTSRSGEFLYLASPGEARTIRFRYPGTNTIRPANADVPLRVAALTTFHVNRHALRNGQTAHFSGQLQGGAVPAGGKLVELQVRLHGHWQTFATARSDPGGHWRFDYSFGATAGHVTYVFRAVVPPEATYPYDGGASHVAKVSVRG